MAPKVVHHVAFGAEALATVLWAIKRPMIVVHSNVDRQIVPVIEALLTIGDWTYENSSRLMVSKMSLQILTRPEFLRTVAIGAPKDLWNLHDSAILASEALFGERLAFGIDIGAESVHGGSFTATRSLLGLSVGCLGARPKKANCLLGRLLNLAIEVHEQDRLSVDFAALEGARIILQLVDG